MKKKLLKLLAASVIYLAAVIIPAGVIYSGIILATGCAGGPKVSQTSVYAGDDFLFQSERLTVQAHELFLTFYRWEKQYRNILPVEVSRAADFARLNEKKWIDTANALHDAYAATPTPANKDKYQLALNEIRAALGQATFYMAQASRTGEAPNAGIAPEAKLKAIGVAPAPALPK